MKVMISMKMMMVPMVVTLIGIITDVSDGHPINAELPNDKDTDRVRVSMNVGNVTIAMIIPMVVTLVGIITDVSDEHDMKAFSPNNRVRVSINAI